MAGKNERQRRQARERYRRQQETRATRQRQVRKRWLTGISAVAAAGLIAALLVVFLPGGSGKKASASASKSPSRRVGVGVGRHRGRARASLHLHQGHPGRTHGQLPAVHAGLHRELPATINTNLGPITVNLLNSKATCTVNSFVHLAEAGYFNNTQCHRMVTSGPYVLQCGDAYATSTTKLDCSATSTVGTGTPGYEFASENLTDAKYPAGTVAMANGGTATSNGSQFFIVYQDSSPDAGNLLYTLRHGFIWAGYRPECGEGWILVHISPGPGSAAAFRRKKVIIDSVTIKKT